MSKATDLLSEEHRVIERVLSALEALVHASLSQGRLEEAPAQMTIDFIKSFADRIHHGKEEDDLFVRMEERGVPHDSGPLAVMLHDHELGRSCVKKMELNVSQAAQGDSAALENFCEAASEYVALLRSHIMKEDRILYPMSDSLLDSKEQQEMLVRFEAACRRDSANYEKYLEIAETLIHSFGESCSDVKEGCGDCSGCCG